MSIAAKYYHYCRSNGIAVSPAAAIQFAYPQYGWGLAGYFHANLALAWGIGELSACGRYVVPIGSN